MILRKNPEYGKIYTWSTTGGINRCARGNVFLDIWTCNKHSPDILHPETMFL